MPLVLPPGFGEATFIWSLSGDPEPMTSALGFQDDGVTGVDVLAQAAETAWSDHNTAAATMTGWHFDGADVRVNRAGVITEGVSREGVTGSNTDQALPNNCAMLVKKLTGLGGRKNRGRMYLPPCYAGEQGIDNRGFQGATDVTAFNARLVSFVSDFTDNVGNPVVLHSGADDPTLITQLLLERQVATQRRRMR